MLMKIICLLTIAIGISIKSNAQTLELTSLKRIDPSTIIASNYVSMPECSISKNKTFDCNNLYTYMQLMVDESGIIYQMLYQTDISDALSYLSISNNVNYQCFTVKKNEYCSCVKKLHEETIPSLQTSGMLDCAIKVLKRCEL